MTDREPISHEGERRGLHWKCRADLLWRALLRASPSRGKSFRRSSNHEPISASAQEPNPTRTFALAVAAWMVVLTLGATLVAQDAGDTVDEALLAKRQGEWRYAGMTVNGKPQVRDWGGEDVSKGKGVRSATK